MAEKTPYQALNPINNLIDEFSPDGGICVAYTTDGCSESVSLELDTLYCNQVDSLYDEDDQPIDPEVFLAQKMVDLISKLEQVKAALLKKYPPKAPAGACETDDFGQEDIAAADAAASQVAGQVLRRAGLVGKGLPS